MPNGNPNFSLEEQDAWFEPISDPICQFVSKHGLYLDKYYHESPSWDLRFGHPLGGNASIEVMNGGNIARLSAVSCLDDYNKFTRFLHRREEVEVPLNAEGISGGLMEELIGTLGTPLGKWTEVRSDYRDIWGRYTRTEFESMGPNYPIPKNVTGDA